MKLLLVPRLRFILLLLLRLQQLRLQRRALLVGRTIDLELIMIVLIHLILIAQIIFLILKVVL